MLTSLVRAATARDIATREQAEDRIAGRVVLLDSTLTPVWVLGRAPRAAGGQAQDHRPEGERAQGASRPGRRDVRHQGYEGSGYFAPRKMPAGGELSDTLKQYNAQISAIRAPVERAIVNIKVWRILHTDYRRPLQTFQDTFHAGIGLYWFKINSCSA